jgi:hypothetical protein
MSLVHPATNDESDDEAADRQTASLGGLAITLLLLVMGLFLVREFQANAVAEWAPSMPGAVVTSSLTEA